MCAPFPAGGVPVVLTADGSGNGQLSGSFDVALLPKANGDELQTTVGFSASLTRPLNQLNFWLTLILALVLGPGIPLGILYLSKWLGSTIPSRVLYGFVTPIEVQDGRCCAAGARSRSTIRTRGTR